MVGLVDWVETYNARVLGGSGNEQAALVRPRPRPARGRRERRPLHRSRSASRTRPSTGDPSTAAGPARGPRRAPSSSRAGRPTSRGSSRRSPRSSSGRAATAGSASAREPGPAGKPASGREGRRAMTEGPQDHRSMADPPGEPVPSEPMQVLRPATVPAVPRLPRRPAGPAHRDSPTARPSSSCRSVAACASPGRSSRSSCRSCSSLLLARTLPGFDLAALPGIIGAANPLLILAGVRDLLRRLPAPRLALGPAPARQRLRHPAARRHRDHLHQLARQLPRAGQARRHLPGLPAEDQLDRCR